MKKPFVAGLSQVLFVFIHLLLALALLALPACRNDAAGRTPKIIADCSARLGRK